LWFPGTVFAFGSFLMICSSLTMYLTRSSRWIDLHEKHANISVLVVCSLNHGGQFAGPTLLHFITEMRIQFKVREFCQRRSWTSQSEQL
jgi:hypothetical protein